ncbi:MAG TPA: response regulator transcription factor [Clostridia bacterium]|nr:response regulator transcription factor [Clostridia bacterium]
MITVWLLEPDNRFRMALVQALNQESDLACAHTFSAIEDVVGALETSSKPDILLAQIQQPVANGIEGVKLIKFKSPDTSVILLTEKDDERSISGAICAGVSGYLLKCSPTQKIIESIRDVYSGGACMTPRIARLVLDMLTRPAGPPKNYHLTEHERAYLHLITRGLTKKEIANQLSVSFHTVDSHLRNIYRKLHVNTRSGAVAKALQERLC